MANIRIKDQTTDTALVAGDYVIVDNATEGTRKFDLGQKLEDIDDDFTDVRQDLSSAVDGRTIEVTIPSPSSGSVVYSIPCPIFAGELYIITITLDVPTRAFSLYSTKNGDNVETLLGGASSVDRKIIMPTIEADSFKYVSTSGAVVNITRATGGVAYNYALQTKLNNLSKNIDYTDDLEDGYIATNISVGSIVDTSVVASSQRKHIIVPCNIGDEFILTGTGGNAPRLWCFTDSNYKVVYVANNGATMTNQILTAIAVGYLIVNVAVASPYSVAKKNGKEFVYSSLANEIGTMTIPDTQNITIVKHYNIITNGDAGTVVDVVNPHSSDNYEYAIIPVIKGERYLVYGTGANAPRLWCFTDSSYAIIKASVSNLDAHVVPADIVAPSDGYLIVNSVIIYGLSVKKYHDANIYSIVEQNYTDIGDVKNDLTVLSDDVDTLLNIPLVEFDYNHDTLDVSSYRELVDYSPNRTPLLEQFYSLFDSLVTAYPSYVSKTDAGEELSLTYPTYANGITTAGTYEVTPAYKTYMYKFIDTNIGAGNSAYNVKKKLLIICGTHGNETMTPFNAFVLASELCKGTDENYAKLRASFDIYIVPCLNGYGMYHNMRPNANWVDINRNFPTDVWHENGADTIGNPNTCVYTGATAGSEFETQLIMGLKDLIQPDFHIDHHNYSDGNGQFYTNVTEQSYLRLVHQCLVDCSIAFVKSFPSYFGNNYLLVIPNSAITYAPRQTVDNKNGKMEVWFAENGCPFSCTIEISSNIRYLNGEMASEPQDWAGATTFSVAEYTLKNQLMRYGQYVLQMP